MFLDDDYDDKNNDFIRVDVNKGKAPSSHAKYFAPTPGLHSHPFLYNYQAPSRSIAVSIQNASSP